MNYRLNLSNTLQNNLIENIFNYEEKLFKNKKSYQVLKLKIEKITDNINVNNSKIEFLAHLNIVLALESEFKFLLTLKK